MEDDVFEPYYGRISTDPQKYVGRAIKIAEPNEPYVYPVYIKIL
jgi:hypothetical protein